MRTKRIAAAVLLLVLFLGAAAGIYFASAPKKAKGYKDYNVKKTQYYVEYSEQFDYWDVLTIEYPYLEGIEETVQEQLNQQFYDTAMDRVNYWHLSPNDTVRALQEEQYQLFASDVHCDVTYHSQYLVSVEFNETYAPGSPVWYVNSTKRAVTADLLTGEVYKPEQILRIDEEFIRQWCKKANGIYEDVIPYNDETCEVLLSWFCGTDEETSNFYELRPYFYVTDEKELVVGIAMDMKDKGFSAGQPSMNAYEVAFTSEELEPFQTESGFWEQYTESETCGTVYECENPATNLWLGEDAGTWDYWEERK